MGYNITINGNYINIHNEQINVFTDRPSKDIVFAKVLVDSDRFTVYYRDKEINGLSDILFSEFELNGVPFASSLDLENWKNANTGGPGIGSSGGGVSSTVTVSNFPTGQSTEVKQDANISKLEEVRVIEQNANTILTTIRNDTALMKAELTTIKNQTVNLATIQNVYVKSDGVSPISMINATTSGTTSGNAWMTEMTVIGNGCTIGEVPVPNGYYVKFERCTGKVGSVAYTVTSPARIIIATVN